MSEEADHSHKVETLCAVDKDRARPWTALVDGEELRGPGGQVRRFETQEAAFEAADFDAWLRDQ